MRKFWKSGLIATALLTGYLYWTTRIPTEINLAAYSSAAVRQASRFVEFPLDYYRYYRVKSPKIRDGEDHKTIEKIVAETRSSLQRLFPNPENPGMYPALSVFSVKGTPYQIGCAKGVVRRDEIIENTHNMMRGLVHKYLFPRMLQHNWNLIEEFVPPEFKDRLEGIADCSGVDLQLLQQLHMVPEVGGRLCSGMAYENQVTEGNNSFHTRVLDFPLQDTLLQNNPTVEIITMLEDDGTPIGNTYVNVTWDGYDWSVGAIGQGSKKVAIGEMSGGDSSELSSERIKGVPMGVHISRLAYLADSLHEVKILQRSWHGNNRYAFVVSDDERSGKMAVGPDVFIYKNPEDDLGPLDKYFFPGEPNISWLGANFDDHIEFLDSRRDLYGKISGLNLEDVKEHAANVAMKSHMHTWIFDRENNFLYVKNTDTDDSLDNGIPFVPVDLSAFTNH